MEFRRPANHQHEANFYGLRKWSSPPFNRTPYPITAQVRSIFKIDDCGLKDSNTKGQWRGFATSAGTFVNLPE